MYHSNFAQMSYSQFFGLCRTRGVGFDIRKKQGSIFTLIEGSQHQHLGFITISDTIENARKSFLNNLKIINEALKQNVSEISSNFQVNENINIFNDCQCFFLLIFSLLSIILNKVKRII